MNNRETLMLAAVQMATINFPRWNEGNSTAAKNYDESLQKKIRENFEFLSGLSQK